MDEGKLDEWQRKLAGPFFRHWRWIVVGAWLLYIAWIVFNRWALIRGFALPDPDDNLRMAEVRAWPGRGGSTFASIGSIRFMAARTSIGRGWSTCRSRGSSC